MEAPETRLEGDIDNQLRRSGLLDKFNMRGGMDSLAEKSTFTPDLMRKMAEFGSDLETLAKELHGVAGIDAIMSRFKSGKIMTPEAIEEAKREALEIAAKEQEKTVLKTVHPRADKALGWSRESKNYILASTSLKSAAIIIKGTNDCLDGELKLRKREDGLERMKDGEIFMTSYIKLLQKDKASGAAGKGREFILHHFETSISLVEKAPRAVKMTFLEELNTTRIDDPEKTEKLATDLTRKYEKLVKEYKGLLDPKIFGVKPAKEFENWFKKGEADEVSTIEKMEVSLDVLKNELIPARQELQDKFEGLPKSITEPHRKNWNENLGYSERKGLFAALQKIEHQKENPLAQQYLKLMTDHPEEFAAKELPQLTEKFLRKNYKEQQQILDGYPAIEIADRKELTERFRGLPEEVQEKNNAKFFGSDKHEKEEHLRILETDKKGAKADTLGTILDTELGLSTARSAFERAMNSKVWGDFAVIDAVALKIKQATAMTGMKSAKDRQLKQTENIAGEQAANKLDYLQGETDTTVNVKTGERREIHSVDMETLGRGGLQESARVDIQNQLLYKTTTAREDQLNTVELYKNTSNKNQEGKSMNLMTEATDKKVFAEKGFELLEYVVKMILRDLTGNSASQEEIAQAAEANSQQLLKLQKESMRQQFRGHIGYSTELLEKKAA